MRKYPLTLQNFLTNGKHLFPATPANNFLCHIPINAKFYTDFKKYKYTSYNSDLLLDPFLTGKFYDTSDKFNNSLSVQNNDRKEYFFEISIKSCID